VAVRQPVAVLLVCSTGGHLLQLVSLQRAWEGYPRAWVTFDKSDARSLLEDEDVIFAYGPTGRSIKNLVRNLILAGRVIRGLRPRVIVTTGAGVAVPFVWIGYVLGSRIVYVESLTRISGPSLSLRLVRPLADRLYVQWPQLHATLRGSRYVGNVLSNR
jgi:UDP-N-acetylglucosamine:LPS N-acetylglucosamine transferase